MSSEPTGESAPARECLLVDDDDLVRTMLSRHLSRAGWTVAEAGSGEQGLGMLASIHPAIVIVDKHMRGIGGMATVREIRQQQSTLPILLISGFIEDADHQELERLAVEFLPKPFVVKRLLDTVARLTEPAL